MTLRSFTRNVRGRAGSPTAKAYLCSPEVCIATALKGAIADPRELGEPPVVETPEEFLVDDGMIVAPSNDPEHVEVVRGPNIKPCPTRGPIEATGDPHRGPHGP